MYLKRPLFIIFRIDALYDSLLFKHYMKMGVVLSDSLPLNSRSDWLLRLNEFKMAAGVVIRIQYGGPLTLMTSPW